MSMEPDQLESFPASPESLDRPQAPPAMPAKGGFWKRATAYLFDLVLVDLIYGVFLLIGAAAVDLASAQQGPGVALGDVVALAGSFVALWASLFLLYFTFFTYYGGQTPGKMLLHLRVVTKDLQDLSLLRALARSLCYALSSLFFGLGFLIAAIDRDKRALHDFLAKTYVVRV